MCDIIISNYYPAVLVDEYSMRKVLLSIFLDFTVYIVSYLSVT